MRFASTLNTSPPRLKIRQCRRGFNLIEAAIVLGIVGLVIGGIWVAASRLAEQQQLKQMATAIIQIRHVHDALYRGIPLPLPYLDITSAMIKAGAVPADLHNGTTAYTPWGTPLIIRNGGHGCSMDGVHEFNRVRIVIPYTRLSQCINLIRNVWQSLYASPTSSGLHISQVHFDQEDIYLSSGSNGSTPAKAYEYAQEHCPLNQQITFLFCVTG